MAIRYKSNNDNTQLQNLTALVGGAGCVITAGEELLNTRFAYNLEETIAVAL